MKPTATLANEQVVKRYKTPTGKDGVICTCWRKVPLTPSGTLYRHSPLQGGGWCPLGGSRILDP